MRGVQLSVTPLAVTSRPTEVWLTVTQAAAWAQCGPKMIYRAVKTGRLRAAVIGGRRELRFRLEWIDNWLDASATANEIRGT
jgi:excisionase family DNA binding protein